MSRRWPAALLLAGPATLLVSLYLPWQESPCAAKSVSGFQSGNGTAAGLQNLFDGSCQLSRVNGWSSVGEIEAISCVLLAFLVITAFIRPSLCDRLPLGHVGLLVCYLAVGDAVQARLAAHRTAAFNGAATGVHLHFQLAYGTYAGVGAGIAALIGATWLRQEQFFVRTSLWVLSEVTVAIVLLGALLLPWWRSELLPHQRESYLGIESASGIIAAILAVRIAACRWEDGASRSLEHVALAGAVLVFTGATFEVGFDNVHAYGAWPGLALAVTLLLVVASGTRRWRMPGLRVLSAFVAVASIGVVASLFLPWQTACYGQSASAKALGLSGRCVSGNGFDLIGTSATALACALAVIALTHQFQRIWMSELAAGLALMVATLGFRLEDGTADGARFGFGYGSFGGFVATGLLLLALGAHRPTFNVRRLGARIPAILLSLFYVAAVVTPWWGVLRGPVWTIFPLQGLDASWLSVAEALLGVRLLGNWLQESHAGSEEIVLLPLALFVLTILELVPFPHMHLTWSSGLLLGLAFALAVLGLVDRQGGIRSLSVPKILRVDRI